jgi:hypothetical protein
MVGVRTAPLIVLRSVGSPAYADRTASDQLPAGVQPSVKLSPVASSTRLDMGTQGFSGRTSTSSQTVRGTHNLLYWSRTESDDLAEPPLRYQRDRTSGALAYAVASSTHRRPSRRSRPSASRAPPRADHARGYARHRDITDSRDTRSYSNRCRTVGV